MKLIPFFACVLALSMPGFGAILFQSTTPADFGNAFNNTNSLFGSYIKQGGTGASYNLQTGVPNGNTNLGTPFSSGLTRGFNLSYNSTTGLTSLTVGGNGPNTITALTGGFNDLGVYVRADANNGSFTGLSITVNNFVLNGTSYTDSLTSAGNGILYFNLLNRLTAADFASGFTLTGDINMSWTGTAPNSRVAFDLIAANVPPPVPEPSTMLLMGSGGAALVGFGLRRRRQA